MNDNVRSAVTFRVTGALGWHALNTIVGLEPDYQRIEQSNLWSMDSRLDPSMSLDAHIADVLAQISTRSDAIRRLHSDYDCHGVLHIACAFGGAAFHLHRSQIAQLKQLQIAVEFELLKNFVV